jgi:predicted transcriptional regulator YdeE
MEKTTILGFKLAGLKLDKKTTNEGGQSNIDCGNLWQKFETENIREKIPAKLTDDIFAVYFDYEGDHSKPFSYFIGCKVAMDAVIPEGLDYLSVPAAKYIQVITKGNMPDCVANAWRDIWSSGINRAYQYDFEVYDEQIKDWSNAVVQIFVSSN